MILSLSRYVLLFIGFSIMLSGCKVYKFTNTSVNPNLRTVSIENFVNQAAIQTGDIAPVMTDKLRQRFLRETNLRFVESDGDISIEGTISSYDVRPVAVSGTETASQNRLNVIVRVNYENKLEPELNFSRTFADGENFDATINLFSIEGELIENITEKIARAIFNQIFANW